MVHRNACTLVRRLVEAKGRIVSWKGGRRDVDCPEAGLEARIVATMPAPAGTGPDAARLMLERLAGGLGAESEVLAMEEEAHTDG